MPPEVSPPAQAVSTIGNSTTAKYLADVDKGNPPSKTTRDSQGISSCSVGKRETAPRPNNFGRPARIGVASDAGRAKA
jgi:hypothetical protein